MLGLYKIKSNINSSGEEESNTLNHVVTSAIKYFV